MNIGKDDTAFKIKDDGAIIRTIDNYKKTIKSKMTDEYSIFISHDARDYQLANLFSQLLTEVSLRKIRVFCSSRTGDIEYGEEWFRKLMDEVTKSDDIVCLLTKNSVRKPWILFEAGLAKGKNLNMKIRGLIIGTTIRNVNKHSPFSQFQHCQYNDEKQVIELISQLLSNVYNTKEKEVKKHIETHVKTFLKKIIKLQNNEKI